MRTPDQWVVPQARWCKKKPTPHWKRTDSEFIVPEMGAASGPMPWASQSGVQTKLMALRYVSHVLRKTDAEANTWLKANSPTNGCHTAMRLRTLNPVEVCGSTVGSIRERVEAYIGFYVEPTNKDDQAGKLPVLRQVSPRDILADGDRSSWEHRFASFFRKDHMMQVQVLGLLEALALGHDAHQVIVWLPPTEGHAVGHVGPLCEPPGTDSSPALTADDGADIKKLWAAIQYGGKGVRVCIKCNCWSVWDGKPLLKGFSKCSDTCRQVGGVCESGCDITISDGKGEDNLEIAAKSFMDLMKGRQWPMYASLTQACGIPDVLLDHARRPHTSLHALCCVFFPVAPRLA